MNIDEPTLMMVLGVASTNASAMFLALHASARHIPGVRLWAFGCLSVGFAVGLRCCSTSHLALAKYYFWQEHRNSLVALVRDIRYLC